MSSLHRILASRTLLCRLNCRKLCSVPPSAISFSANHDHREMDKLCQLLKEKFPQKYFYISKDLNEVQAAGLKNIRSEEEIKQIAQLMQSEPAGFEEKCLSLFESWMTTSKLSLAYYYFAHGKTNFSEEFLTRLIKHFSTYLSVLSPEEMVALWLCIYFKQSISSVENCEINLNDCQASIADLIESGKLNNAEICAIFLSMRKIVDLDIFNPDLRNASFLHISRVLKDVRVSPEEKSMVVTHVMAVLGRNLLQHMRRDDLNVLAKVLDNAAMRKSELTTTCLIQIIHTIGTYKSSLTHPALTEEIIKRLNDPDSDIELKDINRALKYLSIAENSSNQEVIMEGLDSVEALLDKRCQTPDAKLVSTLQYLQCLVHLLSSFKSSKVLTAHIRNVFEAIEKVPDEISNDDLTKEWLLSIHKNLFPNQTFSQNNLNREFETLAHYTGITFYRSVCELVFSCSVLHEEEFPETISEPKKKVIFDILQQKDPRMRTKGQLMKNLRSLNEQMSHNLGGKMYVSLARLFPTSPDPYIVMGQLASIPLTVPEELKGNDYTLKKAPMIGEWYILSLSKTTASQKKLIETWGFNFVDLSNISGSQISSSFSQRIVAEILTGNIHPEGSERRFHVPKGCDNM